MFNPPLETRMFPPPTSNFVIHMGECTVSKWTMVTVQG